MTINNNLSNISHLINKNFSLQEVFNKNVKETLATSISVINNISGNTTGFENLTDSELDFDNDTKVFSIAPTSTSYKIYRDGIEYIISTTKTLTIPNTTGEYFIYFDDNNNLAYLTIFDPSLIFDDVYVAVIHYNASQAKMITDKPCDERHGISMSNATHYYAHTTIGAKWIEGLGLTGFTIDGDGSLDSHSQFTAESGSFADEDIVHIVPSYSQLAVFFRDGTEWKSKTADAFPFIYSGTVGYTGTRICFNENVAENYQLTEVTNDYYILLHPYALNSKQVAVFLGVNQYATLEEARAGANVELSTFNGLPFQEFVKIGSVIVKCSNSFTNTHKVATVSTDLGQNYVDFRRSSTLSIINAGSDHVHSQYLTEAQANTLYTTISAFNTLEGRVDTAETDINNLQALTINDYLPSQTGNSGKALVTDGTNTSWQTISGGGSHASTHGDGGADEISIDASQVTSGLFPVTKLDLISKGGIITSNGSNNLILPVGSDLKIPSADSTASEGISYKYLCELYDPKYYIKFEDDFIGDGANWSVTTTGANTGILLQNTSTQIHEGIVSLQTGTQSTGHTNMTTNTQGFLLGNGLRFFECKIMFPVLSVTGQLYISRIGYGDQGGTVTTEHNQGVYWEYNSSNSLNFAYVSASFGSRTRVLTSIPVVANTWYRLGFLVNDLANSITFYINGVAQPTIITTNITTTGLMGYNIDMRKTSGNISRLAHVDFYRSFKLFTTRTP